jgi:ATP-dependent exoDNAse (exonuclease V) beta subunit
VLVVGDEKQAIYGWRGGDRELMHEPLDTLAAKVGPGEGKTLSESFRSSPAVLTAVNRTFTTLEDGWLDEDHTDKRAIEAAGKAWLSGFPEHKAAEPVKDLRGRVRVIHAPTADDAADDDKHRPLVTSTLELVAEHLKADPQRKIGILLRKKNLMPRLIADIRRAHPDVDVSGEGGNPLTDSRAVEVILDLLAWLDHPGNTAARYLVLNSPLAVAFGFPTLVPEDAASVSEERHVLRNLRRDLIGHGFATTLRRWIRHAAFSSACSDHDVLRCEQLLEVAREFDSREPARPSPFAAHVRARRIEQPGGSGVRVMTIHASKGLEFEAVILLELDAAQGGRGDSIVTGPDGTPRIVPSKKDAPFMKMEDLVEKQVAQDFMEELSVLYVGMTRARSFLDIVLRKDSKPPLARLLRRALKPDSDGAAESFDGISVRESDEKKGRAAIAVDTADSGVSTTASSAAGNKLRAYEGRVMHATPSGSSEGGLVNVSKILAPANRAAMRRGELFHAWIAQIAWIEDGLPEPAALIQSTPEIAREFESRTAAEMARSLIAEVQTAGTELHRAFSKARTASSEKMELWRERRFAILDTSAGRPELLTGSFDRVVLWRDAAGKALRAEIMDFKTDRFDSPEQRVEIDARYGPQLEAYRRALCLLCPGLDASAVAISLVFVRIGEEGHSA